MREIRTYGSVRGVRSNPHPYRDTLQPLRSSAFTGARGIRGSELTPKVRPARVRSDPGSRGSAMSPSVGQESNRVQCAFCLATLTSAESHGAEPASTPKPVRSERREEHWTPASTGARWLGPLSPPISTWRPPSD